MLEQYLAQLEATDATCMIFEGDTQCFHSTDRGVAPLLKFMENHRRGDGHNLILVDRVIGRGAVFLAYQAGISVIYTVTASEEAAAAASLLGLMLSARRIVPRIANRTKDGYCPVEQAVCGITDPDLAEHAIRMRLAELKTERTDR